MATTMTQEQRNEWLQGAWGAQGQEQRNEWLQRAWDAQGEGHVLPRRPPKDRDDVLVARRSDGTGGDGRRGGRAPVPAVAGAPVTRRARSEGSSS
jgi:hypothetical protein